MPVLVALVPPEILQAAPELVRLLDAADFLAAREFRLGGKLEDEAAQGFLEAVGELLVVEAVGIRGGGAFDGDDRCVGLLRFCLCGHSWLAYFVAILLSFVRWIRLRVTLQNRSGPKSGACCRAGRLALGLSLGLL